MEDLVKQRQIKIGMHYANHTFQSFGAYEFVESKVFDYVQSDQIRIVREQTWSSENTDRVLSFIDGRSYDGLLTVEVLKGPKKGQSRFVFTLFDKKGKKFATSDVVDGLDQLKQRLDTFQLWEKLDAFLQPKE